MKNLVMIAAAALSIGMGAGSAFAQAGDESGANAIGQPPRYEQGPSSNAPGYGSYSGYGQDQIYSEQYATVMPQGSVTSGGRYLEDRSSRMEAPRSYYR